MGDFIMPALITDGLLRKTLAATRSLGSRRIDVFVGDTTRLTPAGFSKFSKAALVYPSPGRERRRFLDWLITKGMEHADLVLMPMNDITTQAAFDLEAEHPGLMHMLLPPRDSFEIASDKYRTHVAALTAGIAVPQAWLPGTGIDLDEQVQYNRFPTVIKPRFSSGSRGIRIVNDWEQLLDTYSEVGKHHDDLMIQECIPLGDRYDVALLYDDDGRLVASFVQKEVRHFPADIGPSTVQESVWMPELVERSDALMRSIGWHGIAEVEWMQDSRDGQLKLMEINPRYWNSLHLAIQSGIDFPYMHYCLARHLPIQPKFDYAIGQVTRNLLPGDLLRVMSTRQLRSLDPPLLSKGGKPIQDDIWSARDPMATVGFALACCKYLFDKQMWKSLIKR